MVKGVHPFEGQDERWIMKAAELRALLTELDADSPVLKKEFVLAFKAAKAYQSALDSLPSYPELIKEMKEAEEQTFINTSPIARKDDGLNNFSSALPPRQNSEMETGSKLYRNTVAMSTASPKRKLFGVVPVPQIIATILSLLIQGYVLYRACFRAYDVRVIPVREYGMLIHEFDPWFNFRATQYMYRHGWSAFFSWFDHMSWYPLGRPVGTTTYPGLQFTAVAIHRVLLWLGKPYRMSLNDVCCLIPAWGGVTATLLLALLTYEASGSRTAAVTAAYIFAIIPGHLMRSMAGGFDNECIAMTAMLATFYLWTVSLRNERTWWVGALAGVAYGYMVAAWGGFTFVINMIALHACASAVLDVFRNRYSPGLHKSYTLFFIVGTALATRVPPVGMSPFKSLEQLSALFAFVVLQMVALSEPARRRAGAEVRSTRGLLIKLGFVVIAFLLMAGAVFVLYPTGWFGPLSSRVRGLFLKHTRTGNPLVDSVAEHKPADGNAYWRSFHFACYGWAASALVMPFCWQRGKSILFLMIYSVVAYYFCTKMSRLILLASPVASAGSGLVVGLFIDVLLSELYYAESPNLVANEPKNRIGKKSQSKNDRSAGESWDGLVAVYTNNREARKAVSVVALGATYFILGSMLVVFESHSERMAYAFSSPKIVFKSQQGDGRVLTISDYLDSYKWLKKNTPEDSRILAWWDYGYQITGIANRTTIADGNTWNHEHIATLGKCLTSPVKEAHSLIRHLADYVLVWTGSSGGDVHKSPHMARIGNSVYRDICPNDPQCSQFGFTSQRTPTQLLSKSLVYHLHMNGKDGITVDPSMFQEVHKSQHGLVRIYRVINVSEESKKWLADPSNRVCDHPGSWYCPGQYPPAKEIQDLLKKKIDFAQLEDFNKQRQ